MSKLRNMYRDDFSSVTEELDIIAYNVKALATAAGVSYSTEQTMLVFTQAAGESMSWTVEFGGTVYTPTNGVLEVMVARGVEIAYVVRVAGGDDFEGTVVAEGYNVNIQLPRCIPIKQEYSVSVGTLSPADVVVSLDGIVRSVAMFDAGSKVVVRGTHPLLLPEVTTLLNLSQDEVVDMTLTRPRYTYENVAMTLTYSEVIAASGGVAGPVLSVSATQRDNLSNTTMSVDLAYMQSAGAVISYTVSGSGFSINSTTGNVTAVSKGSVASGQTTGTITCSIAMPYNAAPYTGTGVVYQSANTVTYMQPTVTLVPTSLSIPAAGGTITLPSVSYTQVASYASGGVATATSGGVITYAMDAADGFTLSDASTGSITATELTGASGATRSTTLQVSVALNGKTGSASAVVTQTVA